ncbi:MAG: ribbon-helix-helix protein, CopG family [Microcoleaceae cyanobacterium]
MKAINIHFADEEHKKLQEASKLLERSINELVREAVREHLSKLRRSATSLTCLSPLSNTIASTTILFSSFA